MISDFGLVHNFSGLGLAAEYNHIYPNHVAAVIITIIINADAQIAVGILQGIVFVMKNKLDRIIFIRVKVRVRS